jgi:hypothetical protein
MEVVGEGAAAPGIAGLAALATAKIHCRRPTFNFQTGSESFSGICKLPLPGSWAEKTNF